MGETDRNEGQKISEHERLDSVEQKLKNQEQRGQVHKRCA